MLSKKNLNVKELKEWTVKTKQETSEGFPLELHQRLGGEGGGERRVVLMVMVWKEGKSGTNGES